MDHSILDMPILAVDDNPADVSLMGQMLGRAGFTSVRTLSDPTRVVSSVAADPPDLILLDLHMPRLDGFQILAALLRLWGNASAPPVIAVTTNTSKAMLHRALNYGAVDFVNKPVDQTELTLRVRNHLMVRRMAVELEDRVHDVEAELENERLEAVERLALAAEAHDPGTGEHATRMGCLAAGLAGRLGYAHEECARLERAARVHDIGMIAVPDALLVKAGSFDDAERGIMRTHTTIGAEMLAGSRSPVLKLAETIALSHHEEWSGGGYPAGLSGTDIPMPARIVAVADMFDALTHERPYKAAWSVAEALREIRAQRGVKLDPRVVDEFIELIRSDGVTDFALHPPLVSALGS